MIGVLEEVIESLARRSGGKVQIEIERFADAVEVRVRNWTGGAPIYGGYVETRATLFDDALSDDLAHDYIVRMACEHVRKACTDEPTVPE